jgi:hypothetical protein
MSSTSAAKSHFLKAGPLSLRLERDSAFVRHVRLGDEEVLRGIYGAVRDRNWNTVPAEVVRFDLDANEESFRAEVALECHWRQIGFRWQAEIRGEADGRLTYVFRGEATTRFLRNRIGLCILHPAQLAGRPCVVTRTDGSEWAAAFPLLISPHQPFRDLRAIRHEAAPGVWLSVEMEGEVFEMEDQRNWTDASYKTYCTPLEQPFPVEVLAGSVIEQTVSVTLSGAPLPRRRAAAPRTMVSLAFPPRDERPLPAIGVGMTTEGMKPRDDAIERVKSLGLSHVRTDVRLWRANWTERLERALELAQRLGVAVELAVHVDEETPGEEAIAAQLKPLAHLLRAERPHQVDDCARGPRCPAGTGERGRRPRGRGD